MPKTVLVTGVGGGSGAYTSRILSESGYNVIGTDSSGFANGCVLCNHFCVVNPARDGIAFVRDIKRLMERFEVNVVLPNVDDELLLFAQEFDRRDVIISPAQTVDICLDKFATYNVLHDVVDMPQTVLYQHDTTWYELVGRVVVKPRRGRGSSGVYTFDAPWEVSQCWPLFKNGDYIVQEWIDGVEYTVDCLPNYYDHHLVYPRRRMKTHGGISQVGWSRMNKKIIAAAEKVIDALDFYGPINIQFIVNDRGIYLIEINPRLSGGIGITYANGVNLPDIAVKRHFGEEAYPDEIAQEIVYRYYVEGKK